MEDPTDISGLQPELFNQIDSEVSESTQQPIESGNFIGQQSNESRTTEIVTSDHDHERQEEPTDFPIKNDDFSEDSNLPTYNYEITKVQQFEQPTQQKSNQPVFVTASPTATPFLIPTNEEKLKPPNIIIPVKRMCCGKCCDYFKTMLFIVLLEVRNAYAFILSLAVFLQTTSTSSLQITIAILIGIIIVVSVVDFVVLLIWMGRKHLDSIFRACIFIGTFREFIIYRLVNVVIYLTFMVVGFFLYLTSFRVLELEQMVYDPILVSTHCNCSSEYYRVVNETLQEQSMMTEEPVGNFFGVDITNVQSTIFFFFDAFDSFSQFTGFIIPELLLLINLISILKYNGSSSFQYVKNLKQKNLENKFGIGTIESFPVVSVSIRKIIYINPDKFIQEVITPLSFVNKIEDIKKIKHSSSFSHYNWEYVEKIRCKEDFEILKKFFFEYNEKGEDNIEDHEKETCWMVLCFVAPLTFKWMRAVFCCRTKKIFEKKYVH